ncbi:LacI family DNA-binding transcriptional regulator [Pseudovibrio sp. SPO723]|uniref:LacI family DNA-binding transcriptional regulator n=1 Tax=Nesiotobacter zosterae TaxID=392721 RepID=UPI0029C20370|nr:substrate-binding domain-containing protein [Pseudovibrio sp. SPO723]MDX5592449.1 substrate-binding domain-containing protein [Pseudovibrio sp. SPO723]
MNLKALSEHLGLSQTTVSRALNGYSDVAQETRERVARAAQELGYRPNANAKRLATGRSSIIGVSFPTGRNMLVDPHFIDFLAGLSHQASELDHDILISAIKNDPREAYERMANKGTVDAMVLLGLHFNNEIMELMHSLKLPFIVHGRIPSDASYAYMDIDNYGALYQATKLMLQLGHKRIANLGGPANHSFSRDRARGWSDALGEAGIKPCVEYLRHGYMTDENGYLFAKQVLALEEPPTALICSSVIMAAGAYRACAELGLKVGENVSIMAHDDDLPMYFPEKMDPPLTVTRSPIRAAGVEIAKMAVDLINGAPIESCQKVWPVDLIFRSSTAPPKSA